MNYWCTVIILASLLIAPAAFATPDTKSKTDKVENPLDLPLDKQMSDEPTYIKSDSLSLRSKERIFVYSGNVNVMQGDMTLTSDTVEGRYNDKNKIQSLVAKTNVNITRGEELKARGNQAFYDAVAGTVTLTENPEVEQNGSLLTADKITIFLADNRSVAEGDVRVKLMKDEEEDPAAGAETGTGLPHKGGKHKKHAAP